MPDISLLPALADYFGVTVDALLMHNVNRKDDMKEFAAEIHALVNSGKLAEAYDKLKASMKNWALSASINHLMSFVAYSYGMEKDDEAKPELLEEAIMYADRAIRIDSGESSGTAQAKMTKCFCMVELGRRNEAIKIANTLSSMYSSRERVLAKISGGSEKARCVDMLMQYLDEIKEEFK